MALPATSARLRELLRSRDPDLVAQGAELILTLGEPDLFAEALIGCRILAGGALRGSSAFPGQEDRPFHPDALYPLLSLIAHLPPAARVDPSLHPEGIDSLRIAVQEAVRLPEDLCRLPRLRRLNLSRNGLSTLPEDLPALPHLNQLDLSHNAFSALPTAALCRLPALKSLDLSFNPLPVLSAGVAKLSRLTELRLVGAHLETLPPALASLDHLRVLDLSRCMGLAVLPAVVLDLPRLEILGLRSVPLRLEIDQILRMPALQTLYISRSRYARDAAELRAELRRLRPSLRVSL